MSATTEYTPAYVPDVERLHALEPTADPRQSSLGASAAHSRQAAEYEVYKYDLMNNPDDLVSDPREATVDVEAGLHSGAAEGYISHDVLDRHPDLIAEIDTHYQRLLPDDFYTRHNAQPGTPLSSILRQAISRGADGNFVVPKADYIDLLADLGSVHAQEVAAFAERVPSYVQDYTERLQHGGLPEMAQKFTEQVPKAVIKLDDGFDTLARGGAGYQKEQYGTAMIVMAPLDGERETIMHEFGHLVEGRGLEETFADTPAVATGLREALAEHIENYINQGGDIQTISPEERDGVYETYRSMLDMLCNGGVQGISVREFIRVNIAEAPSKDQALLDAIAQSFPDHPNLIGDLNTKIEASWVRENVTDAAKEQAAEQYILDVKNHYAEKRQRMQEKTSRVRRLLRRFKVLQ